MSTPRVTAEKLKQSEEEREFWKNKSQTAEYKEMAVTRDPTLAEGSAPSEVYRRSRGSPFNNRGSPSERYVESFSQGMEIAAVKEGLALSLGNGRADTKPLSVSPKDVLDAKVRIQTELFKAGKTPEEVKSYLDEVAPTLDAFLMGGDPAQALLFSRLTGSNQQSPTREVLENLQLLNALRPPPPQIDIPALLTALATIVRSNDTRSSDPVSSFNSAVAAISPIFQQMHETTKESLNAQLDLMRSRLDQDKPQKPAEYLKELREVSESMGWGPPQPEDPTITSKRLDLEDRRLAREFEANQETLKSEAQNAMVQTIVGNVSKVLESPIIKELGRNVGKKIGVPENPIAKAAASAAQEQLQNPTEVPWGFTCPKCRTAHSFTQFQLAKIRDAGGRWVDPVCGEVYALKDPASNHSQDREPNI